MNTLSIEFIPTRIQSMSCVGIHSDFPRGTGNYISVSSEKSVYHIINLSGEDLYDSLEFGHVETDMKAIVCKLNIIDYNNKDQYAAYIIDDRFNPVCLRPFWTYNINSNVIAKYIRYLNEIPVDICICEHDIGYNYAVFMNHSSRTAEHGKCIECGTKFTNYRTGWHAGSINPDYFEGTKQFKVTIKDINGPEYIQLLSGMYIFHDTKRWNKDAFKWDLQQFGSKSVLKWKYLEQPDINE